MIFGSKCLVDLKMPTKPSLKPCRCMTPWLWPGPCGETTLMVSLFWKGRNNSLFVCWKGSLINIPTMMVKVRSFQNQSLEFS